MYTRCSVMPFSVNHLSKAMERPGVIPCLAATFARIAVGFTSHPLSRTDRHNSGRGHRHGSDPEGRRFCRAEDGCRWQDARHRRSEVGPRAAPRYPNVTQLFGQAGLKVDQTYLTKVTNAVTPSSKCRLRTCRLPPPPRPSRWHPVRQPNFAMAGAETPAIPFLILRTSRYSGSYM